MELMSGSFGALAVAMIFYAYRDGVYARLRHQKTLRERVAYMLWVTANPDLLKALP